MKQTPVPYLIAGSLLGASLTFLGGILFLRTHLVEEIPFPGKIGTVSGSILSLNALPDIRWHADELPCRLPDSPDGPVKAFRFCHPDYAKLLLEDPEKRKFSAFLPCALSVYAKDDGKLYAARPNMKLLALLSGGEAFRLFRTKIDPEQLELLEAAAAKQR